MSVNRAIFRLDHEEEIIYLAEIANHENYLLVRENLFCPTNGCTCRLVYIPEGEIRAHLRKWNRDTHIETCEFNRQTLNNGRTRIMAGTNTSVLRQEHIATILREIDNKFMESDEERTQRLNRQSEKARRYRANKRINIERSTPAEEVIVNQPTTTSDGETLQEGERNPPVKKRVSVLDFLDADVGKTQSTIGFITSVTNNERQTIITITDNNRRGQLSLYLEDVFFSNSHQNISELLVQLKCIVENGIEVRTSCIGQVIRRNQSFGLLVMNAEEMRFNRGALASLIYKNNR